jgi:hypothetical protein
MTTQDLYNNVKDEVGLEIQSISTDTTTEGEIIDTYGYESLTYVLYSQAITDGDYAPVIEVGNESDLSDAEAIDSDFLLGALADASFASSDANSTKRIGVVSEKRYIRLSIASTNTSTGGTLGATALLGHPRRAPTE